MSFLGQRMLLRFLWFSVLTRGPCFFTVHGEYVVVVVFFTLTDRASTIPSNTRGYQSGTWSAGHLEAVALTGCARGDHTHQLASYFLVRSSTVLRLLSGEQRCFGVLDQVEDIFLVALSDPLQTLNLNNLLLPLSQFNFNLYTMPASL